MYDVIQSRLSVLSRDQIRQMANASGVPFHTLRKLATNETPDPRVSTVVALMPFVGVSFKTCRPKK